MARRIHVLFVGMVTFLLTAMSCNGEQIENLYLEVSSKQLNFFSEGGVNYVRVHSNQDFSVISNNPSWCIAEIISKDNLKVTVSNNDFFMDRMAEITILSDELEEKVKISQLGASPLLAVKESSVIICEEESLDFTLTVTATVPIVFELPGWIDETTGAMPVTGERTYSFTASALHTDELIRSGEIVVKAENPDIVPSKVIPLQLIRETGTTVWDEGSQDLKVIQPGVLSYGESKIIYRRDGQPLVNVELQAPVVVAAATKQEGWGFFQFPGLYRSAVGNLLVASYQMQCDGLECQGTGVSVRMLSSDNGKTWYPSNQSVWGRGLFLPAIGEYITYTSPAPLKVSDLQLPAPVGSNLEASGRLFTYYQMAELPAALQGAYVVRTKDGRSTTIHASLDDPGAVRYSNNDLFPVTWWGDMRLLPDNSIVAGMYAMFYERPNGGVYPSGVSFYRSTDYGMSWKIQGKIPYSYDPLVDPNGHRRLAFGYTEPAFEVLSDGTFLCVMRTDDAYGRGPMYLSRSSDQGVTWSQPQAFTPAGVLPKLLQLENGVLVLASGRPGVQIRFSLDGKGEKWTDPFEMVPFNDANDVAASCGYTQLLATGPDSFLVIYSDFRYLNQNKEERKAIKIREIKIAKKQL